MLIFERKTLCKTNVCWHHVISEEENTIDNVVFLESKQPLKIFFGWHVGPQ